MLANAGIQNILKILDPGVRRDDGKTLFRIVYQFINFYVICLYADLFLCWCAGAFGRLVSQPEGF